MATVREIYEPNPDRGVDDHEAIRFLFSKQYNNDIFDKEGEKQLDSSIQINPIDGCQFRNNKLSVELDDDPLTLQQKNTFNELYEFVTMLQDHNGKVPPIYSFKSNFFEEDDINETIIIEEDFDRKFIRKKIMFKKLILG